jgi:general secretion pathway protein D
MGRRAVALWIIVFAGVARAQDAPPDTPRDEALAELAIAADADVEAVQLLSTWGRRFRALLVVDPQLQPVRIRFMTPVDRLSWAATKAVLDAHDVVVIESQPAIGGPWLIRALHKRNVTGLPSTRFVAPGEATPDGDEVVTAVFPIKHGAGQTIFGTLRTIAVQNASVRVNAMNYVQGPELVVVVDFASRVRYYAQVIEALDVAGPRRELIPYQAQFAPAEQLATLVTQALATLGAPQPTIPGAPASSAAQLLPDARTNQLIISASPGEMPLVRRLLAELDVRVPSATRFHIYRCNFTGKDSDATYLAAKLEQLLSGRAAAAAGPAAGAAGPPVVPAIGELPTRIVPDERKNSLLIQAEEPVYQEVLRLLAELDRPALRVRIEAEIWEISVPTDQLTIGFELAALTNAHEGSTRPAGGTSFGLSDLSIQNDAQGNPTSIGRVPNLGAGLTAIVTRDAFNRIPVIMRAIANFEESKNLTRAHATTNDGEMATFRVADSIPFVTVSQSPTSSIQDVRYADATTGLKITPQVNVDGSVTLAVELEISSFSGSGSVNLPPGKKTGAYSGKVTIPDARYVVFGGLEQDTERRVEAKIPFLGDIPIFGNIFKNQTRTRSRTRLFIFIRPTVLDDETHGMDARVGEALRRRAHAEAEREEWLPPIVAERLLRGPGYDLQEEALERFGRGTGNPFAD